MNIIYRTFRATRRLPLLKELADFLLRSGRNYFWSLRPASMAQTELVPTEFLSVVVEGVSGAQVPFKLIEVGCGDGRVLRRLAERFPSAHFVGIDLQKAAIDVGNKHLARSGVSRGNVQLVCGSCLGDDISWECDFLISRTALIYLDHEEIETFLRKRLPQIGRQAILQEIVSTTGKTERSHFYAHPIADLIEVIAPGQFKLTQEVLAYEPWRSERWTGANLFVTRVRTS